MCMSNAVNQAVMRNVLKKTVGSLADKIGKPEEAKTQTSAQSPTQVNNQIKKKKQKRRIRPRNLRMRGGPGKRSMFGNQENQDANG